MRRVLLAALIAAAIFPAAALARRHAGGPRHGQPGVFDFYVLSLSWSPQYCASHGGGDRLQCGPGRRYAFVLHGLWPQDERGFPESCTRASPLPAKLVDGMLDIMPSAQLVRHEWAQHGTCSGLDAPAYFDRARAAFQAVTIPAAYRSPTKLARVSATELRQQFLHENPKLPSSGIAVLCDGRSLQEVRICLDRHLEPRACSRDVRDRCRGEVIVPPVR
jgi:ribonuclease T2